MAEQEVKKFQSENTVTITGVLEKLVISQTKKDGSPLVTKDGIPFKTARAHIRVADGETHQVEFMAMKHYKDTPNEDTNQWKAFTKYENEYISEEDANNANGEHVGEEPSIVQARAGMELNIYKNQAGILQQNTRLRGFFMNRLKEDEEHGADFQITGVILADPRMEIKNGDETERVLLDVGIIDYQNKAQPFTMIGENYDGIDVVGFLTENVEQGQTMTLNGRLINRYKVEEVVRDAEGGFGKPVVDVKRDRTNEIIIEGGTTPLEHDDFEEGVDNQRVVFPKQFKEAKDNWAKFKAEVEASSGKPKAAAKPAKNKGFGKATTAKKKTNITEDMLPF